MNLCRFRRLIHHRIRSMHVPVPDIIQDGIVKKHGILRYNANITAQGELSHGADILPVHQDTTGLHIVEAEKKPEDRRFTGRQG
ncbi:hypothetical protein BC936DRAFT_143972 [Jimgerdemannia flammicorona]|uniref:Uncharacterized protein n=2 Tax=Jimgerdemannia flammicorona TaxID=994334 RepID=A0A433DD65_9FUNG|nr:hypothetical protein BC936DRAFT_143972 [Jimgerdemannia flammicorona]RUS25799.1 hypothetical protein BC938DRAFT_471657 [Jimgerdemannia flammicorona]